MSSLAAFRRFLESAEFCGVRLDSTKQDVVERLGDANEVDRIRKNVELWSYGARSVQVGLSQNRVSTLGVYYRYADTIDLGRWGLVSPFQGSTTAAEVRTRLEIWHLEVRQSRRFAGMVEVGNSGVLIKFTEEETIDSIQLERISVLKV